MSNYFRFLNQKCPVCEKEFTEGDDIVVCPLCGTPHHRDCYKRNGECANYDEHSKGFRWSPEVIGQPESVAQEAEVQPVAPPVFNSQEAPSTAFFANQSNPLSAFPPEIADGVATEEAAEFVQMSALKYVQQFFYIKSGKRTFNWAAFFFAPYWFFYRKLHKLGAIFLAVTLLLSVGVQLLPPVQQLYTEMEEWLVKYQNVDELSEEEMITASQEQVEMMTGNLPGVAIVMVQGGLSFALQLFIGFKANKWYYDYTVSSIKKIKEKAPEQNERRLLFFKDGGSSMGMAFLAVLASNVITMAVEMIFTFI